jgi:hypothetical protein
MSINIEDYLSDSEIKEMVKEELREQIKFSIKRSGVNTFISNIGYHNVFEIINEEIPNYEEMVKEKTKEVINQLTSFSVFRKADLVDREDSLGQKYLEEAVTNNKELINNKVIEIINALKKQDIADEICSILEDKIYNLFKGEEENQC